MLIGLDLTALYISLLVGLARAACCVVCFFIFNFGNLFSHLIVISLCAILSTYSFNIGAIDF